MDVIFRSPWCVEDVVLKDSVTSHEWCAICILLPYSFVFFFHDSVDISVELYYRKSDERLTFDYEKLPHQTYEWKLAFICDTNTTTDQCSA